MLHYKVPLFVQSSGRATSLSALAMLAVGLSLVQAPVAAQSEEPVDWQAVSLIREEGLRHSQVLEIVEHLTDVIGPRLTASPGGEAANEWAREWLSEQGLANAQLESWGEFGRGWSSDRASLHVLSPRATPISALPLAWTRGTDGPVSGQAVIARIESVGDIESWTGKLAGKIVLRDEPREFEPRDRPDFVRHDHDSLESLETFPIPEPSRGDSEDLAARYRRRIERADLHRQINEFLAREGAVATLEISSRDNGLIRGPQWRFARPRRGTRGTWADGRGRALQLDLPTARERSGCRARGRCFGRIP